MIWSQMLNKNKIYPGKAFSEHKRKVSYISTSLSNSGSIIFYICEKRATPPEIDFIPLLLNSSWNHYHLSTCSLAFSVLFCFIQSLCLYIVSKIYLMLLVCMWEYVCEQAVHIFTLGSLVHICNTLACLIFLAPLSSIYLSQLGNINMWITGGRKCSWLCVYVHVSFTEYEGDLFFFLKVGQILKG